MSQSHLLAAYREKVLAQRALQERVASAETPAAAGLDTILARQTLELELLKPRVLALLEITDDARLYMILHSYYVLGMSSREIANQLFVSERTVNRLKKAYLDELAG